MSATVPETMAMVVAEIDTDEVYLSGHDKQDAATVTMVASIDAIFAHGWTDAAEIYSEAQITGGDTRDLFDAATVTMTAVITGGEGKEYVDADTAQVVAVPVTVENFASVDAAEVIVVADATSINTKDSVDAGTVSSVGLISSAADDTQYHNYVDAATVDVLGLVSAASEFAAHDYTDSDTAQVIAADGGSLNSIDTSDVGVAIVVGVPSGVDSENYTDAADVTTVGVPSAVDSMDYVDAATATFVGLSAALETYGHEDAATVDVIGIASGVDLIANGDFATVDVVGVPSGVEVYTQTPEHANEAYLVAFGSSADGGSDQGHGGDAGNGTVWTLDRIDGATGGISVSITESSHLAADLPIRWQEYQFFSSIPANAYGHFFAIGNAASVGVNTSKTSTKNNPPSASGTSSSATTSGYTIPSLPSIGNLVLVHLFVRGSITASTPTDSSGEAYSLVFSGTSAGGVTHYLWKRVAQANDGAFVVTAALSGSAFWKLSTIIIDTPSSTNIYKMDERAFVNNGGNPLRMTLTAAAH